MTQMKSDGGSRLTGTVTTDIDERCHWETDEGVMGRDTSDGTADEKVKVWGSA